MSEHIQPSDPALASIVAAWGSLPEHIRAAIRALIEPFGGAGEGAR